MDSHVRGYEAMKQELIASSNLITVDSWYRSEITTTASATHLPVGMLVEMVFTNFTSTSTFLIFNQSGRNTPADIDRGNPLVNYSGLTNFSGTVYANFPYCVSHFGDDLLGIYFLGAKTGENSQTSLESDLIYVSLMASGLPSRMFTEFQSKRSGSILVNYYFYY